MSSETKYYCDKCKEEKQSYEVESIYVYVYKSTFSFNHKWVDLCKVCMKKLEEFLGKEKPR